MIYFRLYIGLRFEYSFLEYELSMRFIPIRINQSYLFFIVFHGASCFFFSNDRSDL